MHRRVALIFGIVLLVVVVLAGCTQPQEEAPKKEVVKAPKEEEVKAPKKEEEMPKIEALFAVCVGCHGSQGKGGTGIAPAFQGNEWVRNASIEEIKKTIREGRSYEEKRYAEYASTMPARGGGEYSEEEITALAEYVKGLSQ